MKIVDQKKKAIYELENLIGQHFNNIKLKKKSTTILMLDNNISIKFFIYLINHEYFARSL